MIVAIGTNRFGVDLMLSVTNQNCRGIPEDLVAFEEATEDGLPFAADIASGVQNDDIMRNLQQSRGAFEVFVAEIEVQAQSVGQDIDVSQCGQLQHLVDLFGREKLCFVHEKFPCALELMRDQGEKVIFLGNQMVDLALRTVSGQELAAILGVKLGLHDGDFGRFFCFDLGSGGVRDKTCSFAAAHLTAVKV